MRVLKYMLQIVRKVVRLFEWATGRRHYPWTSSPPHRLFAMVANRARGWPGAQYRALYGFAAGTLKYRERLHGDWVNFGLRLTGPVNAQTLSNTASWEHGTISVLRGSPKSHVNVSVAGDADAVQLDRFTSLLLTSEAIGTINFFFDSDAARDARIHALTVAEEQRGSREDDLATIAPLELTAFQSAAWSSIFSTRTGFDRNVNQYLKIAHPDAIVVALSLPEDDAGFCDAALPSWIDAIGAYTAAEPSVSFVVLNRVGPTALRSVHAALRSRLTFACRAGMSTAEAIFLAQKTAAYVGPLDIFGIAAHAARQAGVYFVNDVQTPPKDARRIVYTNSRSPTEALSRLPLLLADHAGDERARSATPACGSAAVVREYSFTSPSRASEAQAERTLEATIPAAMPLAERSRTARERSPNPVDYTLIVPTYNRPVLLHRLIDYLERSRADFPILIMDSSEAAIQVQNGEMLAAALLNARHVVLPQETNPYAKMRDGVAMVETSYCSLCADDDLVILSAVARCVQSLERESAAAVAHGYYFNFSETASFDLSYIVYRGRSIDAQAPLSRLRALFTAYEAVLYGVYRTAVASKVFRDVEKLDTVLARELLTGAITVIAGACLRVPEFYYGRNTAESLSYSAWHPHQILAENPSQLFSTYPMFRSLVLEALRERGGNHDMGVEASIVDLIMLRYLEPYLRQDVLDFITDQKLRGKESSAIVSRIWDVFVRAPRSAQRTEPLIDRSGAFAPDRIGAGRARDYRHQSFTWDGQTREYNVFYEFLYPDLQPPAAAGKEQLAALIDSLDRY